MSVKKKILTNPLGQTFHTTFYRRREREKEEDNEEEDIHIHKNNTNNNGTNAGEVKRSDLRHFLEQSRNHGLLRPRRLERDLEENRRRMVRRDRVRDRTDRGDRDVRYIVFSLIFYHQVVFCCCFRKGWRFGFSLSRPLFKRRTNATTRYTKTGKRKEKEPARSSSNPSLSDHKTGTR